MKQGCFSVEATILSLPLSLPRGKKRQDCRFYGPFPCGKKRQDCRFYGSPHKNRTLKTKLVNFLLG